MPNDRIRLQHIVDHADELADTMQGWDLDDYLSHRPTQRIVERLLTIIGEAAKELTDETRAAIDQPWREIIRFRDKGIHGYDSLSPRRLYEFATDDVPPLREAVATHLAARTSD